MPTVTVELGVAGRVVIGTFTLSIMRPNAPVMQQQ